MIFEQKGAKHILPILTWSEEDVWNYIRERGLPYSKYYDAPECMRVLKPNGTLIFKWNESEIKASDVLSVIPFKPLFGHTTGRQSKTIWMCFMKLPINE